MGYNNEHAARMVFDIETCPLQEASEYLEPAEAPANYKDKDKIAAYVADQSAKDLDRCGLDVDLCRIVALGYWCEGCPTKVSMLANDEKSETALLRNFWHDAEDKHLVGFNCLGFDLPVLLRRSLYLGVEAPRIAIDKFRHPQVTDLMDELSFAGKLKFRGLSFYTKRFGIAVPDVLTGAGINKAVQDAHWLVVEAHVMADVEKTARLAARLGHFSLPSVDAPIAEAVL